MLRNLKGKDERYNWGMQVKNILSDINCEYLWLEENLDEIQNQFSDLVDKYKVFLETSDLKRVQESRNHG